MTNDEMIDKIVDQMDDWDLETLLEWAKAIRRETLESVGEDVVEKEYQELFGD